MACIMLASELSLSAVIRCPKKDSLYSKNTFTLVTSVSRFRLCDFYQKWLLTASFFSCCMFISDVVFDVKIDTLLEGICLRRTLPMFTNTTLMASVSSVLPFR